MKRINIAIAGLGTVGSGIISLLNKNKRLIQEQYGIDIVIKRVFSRSASKMDGLPIPKEIFTENFHDILNDQEISIVVELIGGIDTAKEIIASSMKAKKHIVTANKAILALYFNELLEIQKEHQVMLGYEASVAGGIPIIKVIRESLAGNQILSIAGIINGTCNYILTKMIQENLSFQDCLKDAQALGFAEADPTLDIGGGDTAHKLIILIYLAFNSLVKYDDLSIEGIENIDIIDILYGLELGFQFKLLGVAKHIDEKHFSAAVFPALVSDHSPLTGVENEFNGILIDSDQLGTSLYYGKGAGKGPTASSVASDIIEIAHKLSLNSIFDYHLSSKPTPKKMINIHETEFSYYIRLNTVDKIGVLKEITTVFADKSISIARMFQEEAEDKDYVHVVIITHKAKEGDVLSALSQISGKDFNRQPYVFYRVYP